MLHRHEMEMLSNWKLLSSNYELAAFIWSKYIENHNIVKYYYNFIMSYVYIFKITFCCDGNSSL